MIEVILIVLISLFFLILSPFVDFLLGFIIGIVIKLIFSDIFIKGLSLLNISISVNQIPMFCGILSLIGSFFKSHSVKESNKYDDNMEDKTSF